MDAIYVAAGAESLTPEMLDVIADPSLDPDSMTALKVSFQQGATIADVQHEKQGMQGSIKAVSYTHLSNCKKVSTSVTTATR